MKMKTLLQTLTEAKNKDGFHTNIEKDTTANKNYRQVISTTKKTQLVLMTLQPGEDIGEETHNGDQFFRFEKGTGQFKMGDNTYPIQAGSAFVVPTGVAHNVINNSNAPLHLYALYAPPQHAPETIHKTKAAADEAE